MRYVHPQNGDLSLCVYLFQILPNRAVFDSRLRRGGTGGEGATGPVAVDSSRSLPTVTSAGFGCLGAWAPGERAGGDCVVDDGVVDGRHCENVCAVSGGGPSDGLRSAPAACVWFSCCLVRAGEAIDEGRAGVGAAVPGDTDACDDGCCCWGCLPPLTGGRLKADERDGLVCSVDSNGEM